MAIALEKTLETYPIVNAAILVLFVTVLWTYLSRNMTIHPEAPPLARQSYPFIGAPNYVLNSWHFTRAESRAVKNSNKANPLQAFSFKLGRLPVIGITGPVARKWLLTDPGLDFDRGWETLFGGQARAPAKVILDDTDTGVMETSQFILRFKPLMTTVWMQKALDRMIEDSFELFEFLGDSGTTNPWDTVYRLVYRLTVRSVGCKEIAESPELLKSTLANYEGIEQGVKPSAMLAPPWFPTIGKLKQAYHGARLYFTLKTIIETRERNNRREDDPLQTLIDRGDNIHSILEFLMGALLAGQVNSGVIAAWLLCHLAVRPDWKDRTRREVDALITQYGGDTGTLLERAKKIPLSVWEEGSQSLSLALKETIRLALRGNLPRLNVGPDKRHGDYIIPHDVFVTYPVADVHFDEKHYKDPFLFQPERYLPGREEGKAQEYGWIGWGAGRHPCAGMRFAKLEIHVIVFLFLAAYDWDITDKNGKLLDVHTLPVPDLNDPIAQRPPIRSHIRYRKRQ